MYASRSLVVATALLGGCDGIGYMQGRIVLPVSQTDGRPIVPDDQVCKQLRIDVGVMQRYRCEHPGGSRYITKFKVLLAPLRFEDSAYDPRSFSCPYKVDWPVGSYKLRAYYLTNGSAAGGTTPTWDPQVSNTEWVSTEYLDQTFVKDQASQRDLKLVRGPAILPPLEFGKCTEVK